MVITRKELFLSIPNTFLSRWNDESKEIYLEILLQDYSPKEHLWLSNIKQHRNVIVIDEYINRLTHKPIRVIQLRL